MTVADDRAEAYFSALAGVDATRASDVVLDLLYEGSPVDRITSEVLAPAQVRVGELWAQGRWTVADEHAATAVTETALSALSAATSRRRGTRPRHVVVACAEGEWHTLPARMAATVAASGEVRVTVLGPSVPADHLGQRLAAGDVDVLALSCTVPPNLLGAARCVRAAHQAGVPVIAGGRAFGSTPRRAHAVGADAWAADPGVLAGPTPPLAGRDPVISNEAELLDAVDDGTVAMAYERLLAAVPTQQHLPPLQQARTREDLRWMVRFAGAAVVTSDETVLDEYLAWCGALLGGRTPRQDIATSALLVADTVEAFAPSGALLLRRAADRMVPAG